MAVAVLAQSPPGEATTCQSPSCQTTSIRVAASTVVPPLPGPAVTTSATAADGGVGDEPVGGHDRVAAPGGLSRPDVGGGAELGGGGGVVPGRSWRHLGSRGRVPAAVQALAVQQQHGGGGEQDRQAGGDEGGAAGAWGGHGRAHMKTATMPEDGAIRVSPASTQGMPVAPSAGRLDRLRRPIAIIAPQPIRPNTPAIRPPPFPQASRVLARPDTPGAATGARLGSTPAPHPAWH